MALTTNLKDLASVILLMLRCQQVFLKLNTC